jgi:hypothetical protein
MLTASQAVDGNMAHTHKPHNTTLPSAYSKVAAFPAIFENSEPSRDLFHHIDLKDRQKEEMPWAFRSRPTYRLPSSAIFAFYAVNNLIPRWPCRCCTLIA